jgi:hypothetical protein
MPVTTKLSLEKVKGTIESVKRFLKSLAVKKGIAANEADVILRDILPATDLGFTKEDFAVTLSTADAFNTVINQRLGDKKLLVIFGVRDISTTPIVSAIKFAKGPDGAITKDIVEIEGLETQKEREVIFNTPIKYENGEHMFIQYFAKAAGTARLVLLGVVAEPRGELVSE